MAGFLVGPELALGLAFVAGLALSLGVDGWGDIVGAALMSVCVWGPALLAWRKRHTEDRRAP